MEVSSAPFHRILRIIENKVSQTLSLDKSRTAMLFLSIIYSLFKKVKIVSKSLLLSKHITINHWRISLEKSNIQVRPQIHGSLPTSWKGEKQLTLWSMPTHRKNFGNQILRNRQRKTKCTFFSLKLTRQRKNFWIGYPWRTQRPR